MDAQSLINDLSNRVQANDIDGGKTVLTQLKVRSRSIQESAAKDISHRLSRLLYRSIGFGTLPKCC